MTPVFVHVPNVRAVSNGLTLICELPDKRRIGVPVTWIHPRSQVHRPGDFGTLIIPHRLARDLGVDGDGQ